MTARLQDRHSERDETTAYLCGQYEMCALLLTSPRFNKPQRELITNLALEIKEKLEERGEAFSDA